MINTPAFVAELNMYIKYLKNEIKNIAEKNRDKEAGDYLNLPKIYSKELNTISN